MAVGETAEDLRGGRPGRREAQAGPIAIAPQRGRRERRRFMLESRVTDAISTGMATGLVVSGKPGGWWGRLRHEWTKNDGKPWEEWTPGHDLKDTVLIAICVVFLLLQMGALIAGVFS